MKYILLTLLISTTANAAIVKAPLQSCGVGKVCVSEQFTCPIKKPVKAKKKLYKATKQTVIPVAPVVEEKPCEITQHFYFDEIIYPDYLGKLPRHDFERVTRPNTEPYRWNWTPNNNYGGYYVRDREVIKTVVKYLPAPTIITPPIATPLPSSMWLLVGGLLLFWRRAWLNLN